MFVSGIGSDHLCGNCLQNAFHFRRARSAGVYGGALLAMIHQLKYRACLALCNPLGALLQQAFAHYWQPEEIDLVLPIPLHRKRIRHRGFNQAYLIARAWAGIPNARSIATRLAAPREVMIRSRPTHPQTGLGKKARRRNIRGAFRVVAPDRVKGRHILLVDDVFTTGATADEAARQLGRFGAASVDLLTVARTLPKATGRWSQIRNRRYG
jgi:ComF family protein